MAKLQSGFGYSKVLLLKDQLLGNGTYGVVCRAQCDDLPCAAKILHPLLVVTEANIGPLEQECQRLISVRNPHIVQYLGTHVDGPNSLSILMELMDRNLTSFLERSASPLPFHTEINLCHDVSLALSYLHSNDVTHCNLSSNNVLLTPDLRAKLADFGMSKLVGSSVLPSPSSLTPVRGSSAAYMSPESLADTPTFSQKLDTFSFGVLALQILTRKFPDPGPSRRRIENQDYGSATPVTVAVPDVERRRAHIDLVDPKHPLVGAITSCLAYAERERPTARDLCVQISHFKKSDQYLASAQQDLEVTREVLQNRLETSNQELLKANEQLLNAELLKMQLLGKDMEVLSANEDKRVAEEAMSKLQSQLEVKDKELRAAESVKRELLDVKDGQLRAAEESRKELYGHLRVKDEELKASEESRRELQKQLRVKNEELLIVYEQLRKEQYEVEMLKRKQVAWTGDQRRADQNQIGCTINDGVEIHLNGMEEVRHAEHLQREPAPPTVPPISPPTAPPISPPTAPPTFAEATSISIAQTEALLAQPSGTTLRPPPSSSSSDHRGRDVTLTIVLDKGPSGSMGIGIAGGVDNPCIEGNFGIFITKIVPEGIAGRDGRLRLGDQILSINGVLLENVSHIQAVTMMRQTEQQVTLVILRSEGIDVSPLLVKRGISGSALPSEQATPPSNATDIVEITLQKNTKDYGFDISGGCGSQYVLGDNGIFITKIAPRGPAEDCGFLDVGDRILEVDGKSLVDVSYDVAIALLLKAQDKMVLKIEKNAVNNLGATITTEVRAVVLNSPEGQSLGISLFGSDTTTGVYISAITPDSVAARSNLLRIGDHILKVNHNDLQKASLKEAVMALEHVGTTVALLVEYRPDDIKDILSRIAQYQTSLVSRPPLKVEQIYVRALFNYDAAQEEAPPPDTLTFVQGDILHILNGSGEVWWQAAAVNNQGVDTHVGRVPSIKKIISGLSRKYVPKPPPSPRAEKKPTKAQKQKQKAKQKKDSVSSLAVDPSIEEQKCNTAAADEYTPTYAPVQKDQSGRFHPIIILGPLKDEIIDRLVRDFPSDYARCVEHTTRPPKEREEDGRDYHFVSVDQMDKDIQSHKFIEVNRHDGYLYGTSITAVRTVIEQGKHCLLGVSGYAISCLQSAGLYPVTLCTRPNSWNLVYDIKKLTVEECQGIVWRGVTTEQEFINYISAVITGSSMAELYNGVKTAINNHSGGPIWILTDDLLL